MEMREVHIIEPADLDLAGSMLLTKLLDWMQRLADTHAYTLGVGRGALLMQNLVWMSARNAICLYRELKEGEKVTLYTWTGENTRAACPRYFAFYDRKGECVGGAASLWMLIQPDTRRIVSPQKAGILTGQATMHEPVLKWAQQLPHMKDADSTVLRKPAYSDLDANGHVNNVRYAEWVLDALPLDVLGKHFISELNLSYLHEIKPEDSCLLMAEKTESGYLICGKSQQGDRSFFEALVKLTPRDERKGR